MIKQTMKFCKAWPDACQSQSSNANASGTTDAVVEPKSTQDIHSVVQTLVDQTVEDLWKSSFEADTDEPSAPEPPKKPSKRRQNVKHAPTDNHASRQTDRNEMLALWAVVALMAIVGFVTLQGLVGRVDKLEAWLHGRLSART